MAHTVFTGVYDLHRALAVSARIDMARNLSTAVGFLITQTYALIRLTRSWSEGNTSSGTGQGAPAVIGDATWEYAFFDTNAVSWRLMASFLDSLC